MSTDTEKRSRRAILAGATAGAAAMAVAALAKPAGMLAATGDPVEVDGSHTGVGTTSISTTAAAPAFQGDSTDDDGVGLSGVGALSATSASVGVVGSGDLGVVGGGLIGVFGLGDVVGTLGDSGPTGVGLYGHTGPSNAPQPPLGVGVVASAETSSLTALRVMGVARFSRSGRATVAAGKSTVIVNLAGVTANSMVFAVLRQSRASRWVRAVVAVAGSFTVRLNGTVSSSTQVNWIVFD